MADKTPVRVVFNASNVATGMAEFQSGETVPVANGGTGISSIGSAGQVLKVNAAGNALEFGAEGDISITNLVAPTNADLTFQTSGTGNIVLDAVTVRGTTFSAADSTKITIAEALDVTGALTFSGLTLPTSDGTVGQFLQTDGAGTLSFASVSVGDLDIVGSSIASPSNADLTLDPSGSGNIKLNATTDITGSATITTTTTDDSLLITSTEDSNSAAPVVTLKRNSSSPADADYLGRIKFKGENDANQEVQYGSISGKILDASDGTEDGAIEFNVKKAGSNNIAVRINSDVVKLLNSTNLEVAGLTYPTADGSAGQFLKTDGSGNLSFASVSVGDFTFVGSTLSSPSNADITLDPSGSGDIQLKANTVVTGTMTTTGNVLLGEDATIIFEGASDSTNETTLTVVDPTADRTISLPNKSGTLATTSDTAFPNSTTPTHPAANGDADLGSNLTDSIVDPFGIPTADLYDHMEPRGTTVTVDLGAFS